MKRLPLAACLAVLLGVTLFAVTRTDDFNRTDAATLGANWATPADAEAFQVYGNLAYPHAAGAVYSWTYWSADTFGDTQSAEATLGAYSASFQIGVAVRMQAGAVTQGYACVAWVGAYAIREFSDSDSSVELVGSLGTPQNGDVLKCQTDATTGITFYVNGVSVGSTTDGTYTSGRTGVMGYGAVMTLNDWTGSDGAAAPATAKRLTLLGVGR